MPLRVGSVGHTLLIAAVLVFVLTASSSSGCRIGPPSVHTQVKRFLQAGQPAQALAAATKASPDEKAAVAATLRAAAGWDDRCWACEAYLAAIELTPFELEAYESLVQALQDPSLEGHAFFVLTGGGKPGARGLAAWEAALLERPALRTDLRFVRVGADLAMAARKYARATEINPDDAEAHIRAAMEALEAGNSAAASRFATRARELAPRDSTVLCVQAQLGLLEPVASSRVLDVVLPEGFWPNELQVSGEILLLAGSNPEVGCEIHLLSALDGSRRRKIRTTINAPVSLSPSGRYVAYGEGTEWISPCDIRVIDTETGSTRVLLTTPQPPFHMAWSPDETRLAVSSEEGLSVVSVDGEGRQLVGAAAGTGDSREIPAYPHWLPGGNLLASQALLYDEGAGLPKVYDLDSASVTEIPVSPEGWPLGVVLWSPDGQLFAYCVDPSGYSQVYMGTVGTSVAQPVAVSSRHLGGSPLTWSPNSDQLLFTMSLSPLCSQRLWKWDRADGAVSLVQHAAPWLIAWGGHGVVYFVEGGGQPASLRLVGIRIGPG